MVLAVKLEPRRRKSPGKSIAGHKKSDMRGQFLFRTAVISRQPATPLHSSFSLQPPNCVPGPSGARGEVLLSRKKLKKPFDFWQIPAVPNCFLSLGENRKIGASFHTRKKSHPFAAKSQLQSKLYRRDQPFMMASLPTFLLAFLTAFLPAFIEDLFVNR